MELWTVPHAQTLPPAFAAMVIIAIVLRLTIGNKPMKIRMIPFQILACAAFLLEVGKQAVSFSRGYDLYHIPLHFCSLFIFAIPLMAFYNGKHTNTVRGVVATLSAAMTLMLLIYPNIIYSADNVRNFFGDYLDMHTVAFHNIVMFEFILILALGLHTPDRKKEVKAVVVTAVIFCAVASSMAQILKVNFANFYTCNIPVFESIRTSLQGTIGVVPTQIIYVLIVAALHIAFVYLSYWAYCFLHFIFGLKEKKEQTV